MERQSSAFSYEYIWEYTPESRNRENAGRARIPRLFIRRYVYSRYEEHTSELQSIPTRLSSDLSSAFSYEYIWEYTPESRNRENAGRARIPRLFIRRYVYSVNAIKYRPSRQGNRKGPGNRRAAAGLGPVADAFPDIRTWVNSGRERV